MEGLQRQMLELHYKVDQLYRIAERLSDQLETVLAEQSKQNTGKTKSPAAVVNKFTPLSRQKITEHKDILDDSGSGREYYQKSDLEELLSPDVQIQRLTAQLTASYHRIAALEEQLLAVRSQSY